MIEGMLEHPLTPQSKENIIPPTAAASSDAAATAADRQNSPPSIRQKG